MLLSKDHHGFAAIHLHRVGNRVRCYLEQLEQGAVPTRDPNRNNDEVFSSQKKFWPVMKEMASCAKKRLNMDVEFIPVFCDGRLTVVNEWSTFWKAKMEEDCSVQIVACVTATKASLPFLFPCIEHRIALLSEDSFKHSASSLHCTEGSVLPRRS